MSFKKKRNPNSLPPSKKSMETLLVQSGLKVTSAKLELLWQYHQLLRQADQELNLTRLRNFESMVIKHYVDCLIIRKYHSLPSPLLDFGTGAGLPGIPLKIFMPSVQIILAEKRQNRVEFLRQTCEALKLEVIIHPHSINRSFPHAVQGVITRAVETIPDTLKRIQDFLPPGGEAIFMKGPSCAEEIEEGKKNWGNLFELKKEVDYVLPHTENYRKLVVFEKKLLESSGENEEDKNP